MLCNTFKRLALDTWDQIAKSRSVGFQLKEETITDLTMLELKIRHPGEVITYAFDKHEEGENGADWEWWFTDKSKKWLGLRVQAKIINIADDKFQHLHYRKDSKSLYQSELLVLKSRTGAHQTIPLYCLYLQTENVSTLPKAHTAATTHELLGCSLLSAVAVNKLRPSKKLTDLQDMLPWHLLVCKNQDLGIIKHMTDFLQSTLSIDIENKDLLLDNPPSYVKLILASQGNRATDGELSIGLAGVMVYQDSNL